MSNRRRAVRRDHQRVEQERENQRRHQEEQLAMQEAFGRDGQMQKGWMEDLIGIDDLDERLQERSIEKIRALLNRQWVLSNLTDAEAHDARYKLEVMKYKINGEHPPEESAIQGPLRQFLFENETEGLWALTPGERNTIDQIIESLKTMVTRGRGGFERKQMNTRYGAAMRVGQDEEEGGRFRGLFGGG